MLNVPQEIKDLLHTDSVKKNIRIHFPDGERTDICNDLIVMNTVSFTESLCSQNNFKFGLCESSIFQCEVVGVGDIQGAYIEVYCEIYCDSTVSGAVWKTDLGHHVYAIPYGVFVVKEAKRQADIIHRKIVAYTDATLSNANASNDFSAKTNYEYAKALVLTSSNVAYTPNIVYFSYVNNFHYSDELFTVSNVPYTSRFIDGTLYTDYTIKYEYCTNWSIEENDSNCLYTLKGDYSKLVALIEEFAKQVIEMFPGWSKETIINNLYDTLGITAQWRSGLDTYKCFVGFPKRMPTTFYPFINGWFSEGNNRHFEIEVYTGNISIALGTAVVVSANVGYDYTVEKREIINTYQGVNLNFTRYYGTIKKPNWSPVYGWIINFNPSGDDANNYDSFNSETLIDINNSFLEMSGVYGKIDRYGGIEIIDMKRQFNLLPGTSLYPSTNLHPEGVTGGRLLPEDYQSCWYDDHYTLPFGVVQCQYKDTNNKDCTYRLYIQGFDENSDTNTYKVYELSNNSYIKKRVWTEQQISGICNAIANNIYQVSYMPVNFVGRGLPYVESGDTFEILTASNDSITTIVLNRTISGEQVLVDTYKST